MHSYTLRVVPGYSSVDHFGPEIADLARSDRAYATRRGARLAGERAIIRVKRAFQAARRARGQAIFGLPRIDVEV